MFRQREIKIVFFSNSSCFLLSTKRTISGESRVKTADKVSLYFHQWTIFISCVGISQYFHPPSRFDVISSLTVIQLTRWALKPQCLKGVKPIPIQQLFTFDIHFGHIALVALVLMCFSRHVPELYYMFIIYMFIRLFTMRSWVSHLSSKFPNWNQRASLEHTSTCLLTAEVEAVLSTLPLARWLAKIVRLI